MKIRIAKVKHAVLKQSNVCSSLDLEDVRSEWSPPAPATSSREHHLPLEMGRLIQRCRNSVHFCKAYWFETVCWSLYQTAISRLLIMSEASYVTETPEMVPISWGRERTLHVLLRHSIEFTRGKRRLWLQASLWFFLHNYSPNTDDENALLSPCFTA